VLPQTLVHSKGFFRFSVIWLENSKRFGKEQRFKFMAGKEKPPLAGESRKSIRPPPIAVPKLDHRPTFGTMCTQSAGAQQ
jgi:hypothetical protein